MAIDIVYHGSYFEIKKPKIVISKFNKDFGQGFYCTTIKEQSQRWARRNPQPFVNGYSCIINNNLNIKNFISMTDEWLDFIVGCRHGEKHNYDIVIGAMANDQIFNYVEDYISGALTREQFWILAKFKYPTNQICFCSDRSLECLDFKFSERYQDGHWEKYSM